MCRGCLCLCNSSFYVYTTVVPHGFEDFHHYSQARILISLREPSNPINQGSAFVGTESINLKATTQI